MEGHLLQEVCYVTSRFLLCIYDVNVLIGL